MALRKENFKKAAKIEQKMTDYKNKDNNYKKITRPIFAHVVFRKDEALHSVLELTREAKEGEA